MRYRIFIFMVVCTALLIASCGNKEPMAPKSKELAGNDQELSLANKSNIIVTPYEATETRLEYLDQGKQWYSGDGTILYVKGMVLKDNVESDEIRVDGIITATCDYELNLVTGSGTYFSKWSLATDAVAGTWEGTLAGEFTNYLFSGYSVGKGKGDLKKSKITVDMHEDPNNPGLYLISGHIIEEK